MNNGAKNPVARPAQSNIRVQMRPVGSAMFSEHAWEEIARSLKLSGRELQIVRGIFDDDTDLGIAQRLGISLSTVHTHVERLHRKLAVMDRPQLLLCVMQEFVTLTVSPANDLPHLCAKHGSGGCPFSP
jgi:DNA-binding NarL/FixJ family response regulator